MSSIMAVLVAGSCCFGLVVLAVLVGVWASYNGLVRLRNTVRESWRQVDVELQRRHDLVPNLVQTTVAAAQFERGAIERVVAARNFAVEASGFSGSVARAAYAEGQLSSALRGFFAVAESYPTLRSNANFVQLQSELANTEDRIAASRRFYNGNVRELNVKVESFPSNLIAGAFGFQQSEYFELDDPAARQRPDLSGAFDVLRPPQG
ncbi:LemA family protein [Segniliparus rugosus]|uniref:LemA family protein n=1 Tax=Segniliparus rugosus (strain ATCC BAA-974 / DSM 45345 / CCUG 50838 / CIP 108380 / JCM 13579 / CDC 945) TaxID=679197 RepID=E5XLD0_SEGRC|nr:LemA family protein [Segniliparus rugosus]EFV14849.1 hypothetical protein HMPREF9336_00299 [Segniliparus rugosus ATCC BAA-974]